MEIITICIELNKFVKLYCCKKERCLSSEKHLIKFRNFIVSKYPEDCKAFFTMRYASTSAKIAYGAVFPTVSYLEFPMEILLNI